MRICSNRVLRRSKWPPFDTQPAAATDESYRCTLYDVLRGDSEMVQRLATEMYARGLSTRDRTGG